MAENKLKADISGNLDLSTFNQMGDALQILSDTLDTFPDALDNIMGYAQSLAEEFTKVADPSLIDGNIFSSIFLANIATMMVALEILKTELSKMPNVSVNVDTISIDDLIAKLQNITIQVTLDTAPTKLAWNEILALLLSGIGVVSSVTNVIRSLVSKTGKKIKENVENINKIISDIANDSLSDEMKENFEKIGDAFTSGLIISLNEGIDKLVDVMIQIAKEMLDGFCKALGINSPSKVMYEKGSYMIDGLVNALNDGSKDASNTMKNLSKNVENATSDFSSVSKQSKKFANGLSDVTKKTKKMGKMTASATKSARSSFKKMKGEVKSVDNSIEAADKTANKFSDTSKKGFGGFAIIAGIVSTLVRYFVNLMNTNEEFAAKVTAVTDKLKEAFQPVIDLVIGLFESIFSGSESVGGVGEVIGGVAEKVTGVVSGIVEFLSGVITYITEFFAEHGEAILAALGSAWETISSLFGSVFEFLKALWDEYGEKIMTGIQVVWNFLSGIISGVVTFITGVFDILVGIFTGNGEKIKEGFAKIWTGIKKIFSKVAGFFGGIWEKVKEKFTSIGSKIGNAIGDAFKFVVNSIIGFAERTINGFIKAINKAINLINAIPGVNIKKLKLLVIPKLANGGLLDPGQMFIAREAGPELVSNFGNKTAVMNNNQIVESVSQGVYQAVAAALSGKSSSDQPLNIVLKVGETDFGKVAVNSINSLSRVQGSVNLAI